MYSVYFKPPVPITPPADHYSLVNLVVFILFMKFYIRFQRAEVRCQISRFSSLSNGAAVTAFVVALVLVPPQKKIDFENEHEDEDEKNQIKSFAYALRPQPYAMRIV